MEVVYGVAAAARVHPWQGEEVGLAAAAAPGSGVPPAGSGIHYNRIVELAVPVVSVAVVVMAVAAVGEELLLPFYRMTGAVCSSFDMHWWKMVLEVPGYGSNTHPRRRREVGRGRDWVGVGLVGGDHLCCGGYRFAGVALRASCHSTVLLWRALHEDHIVPLWRC